MKRHFPRHSPRPLRLLPLLSAIGLVCLSLVAQAATPPAEPVFVYATRTGDTLITLAERFLSRSQDWPVLAKLNHIANPRRIPVGTALRIPESLMRGTSRDGTVLASVGESSVLDAQTGPTGRRIQPGDAISPGSLVRTSGNGYVTVQLADGSVLRIQADTQAKLEKSQQYEAAGFFASAWQLLQGRVEALVTHLTGGEPRFQIKTPQAVLGVRGTEFRVSTDGPQGITRGETLTGAVGVQGAQNETLVSAGYGARVDGKEPVSSAVPLLSAPNLTAQPTLQERILVRFELPPVPGAVQYRAQVAEDEDFRLVRGEVVSDQPLLRFSDLADGSYWMRARAIDANGLAGIDAVHRFRLKARPEAPIANEPAPRSKWRAASVHLRWSEHPLAKTYHLQVATSADFSGLVLDRSDLTGTELDLPLPVGDYHWRLATVAAGPDQGPWSDVQGFAMRALPTAPPPPTVDDQHIRFQLPGEPGQRFEFQVARDEAFRDLVQELSTPNPTVVLDKPQEGGRFLVRFRAIDPDGFVGPYTATQSFALPRCVRTGTGECLMGGSHTATSPL